MPTLGRLEKVKLRDEWESEAQDFTPWLAKEENLAILSETLGIDIEPIAEEHPVGPFRADILATDANTNELILIENQLEKTDHNHLGQLLTYASGLQAVTAIWICKRFTDEHAAALSWLNDHTNGKLNLFGLEVELWRIGDSAPAPKFNIVVKPNDWVKSNSQSGPVGLSETNVQQRDFWEGFREWVEENGQGLINPTKPHPCHWMSISPFKTWAFGAAFLIITKGDGELRVEVQCRGDHKTENYLYLESKKEELEAELGATLQWHGTDNKHQNKIDLIKTGVDWKNPKDREKNYSWLLENMERMITVFQPHCNAAIGR